MSHSPDTPTDAPSGTPQRPGPRLLSISPLTLALLSLAVAMVVVTILVQLVGQDPAPDVREVLDEGSAPPTSVEPSDLDAGDQAPAVTLEWLDGGEPTTLTELTTTPVVLNFWSSTCAPCRSEMPAFETVHRSTDAVTFVGVDVTDTAEAGSTMAAETGVTYRSARDPRGELLAAFGASALPYTVVLDSGGTILAEHAGALSQADLQDLLREHGLLA